MLIPLLMTTSPCITSLPTAPSEAVQVERQLPQATDVQQDPGTALAPVEEQPPPPRNWVWYAKGTLVELHGTNMAAASFIEWTVLPNGLPSGLETFGPEPRLIEPNLKDHFSISSTTLERLGSLGTLTFLQSSTSQGCTKHSREEWWAWDGIQERRALDLVTRESLLSALLKDPQFRLQHHFSGDANALEALLKDGDYWGHPEPIQSWGVLPLDWDAKTQQLTVLLGIPTPADTYTMHVQTTVHPYQLRLSPTPLLLAQLQAQELLLLEAPETLLAFQEGELHAALSIQLSHSNTWPLACPGPANSEAESKLTNTLEAPALWCSRAVGFPRNAEFYERIEVLGQVGPYLTTLSENNLPTSTPPRPRTIDLRTGEVLLNLAGMWPVGSENGGILYRSASDAVHLETVSEDFNAVWLRLAMWADDLGPTDNQEPPDL